jgi:hypothetical protein
MSSTPLRTQKHRHHPDSSSTSAAAPPATPANSAEPASIGSGFGLQDHPGDKGFSRQFKDWSYASLGGIREGHYTEF